jgi:hypothetical protein
MLVHPRHRASQESQDALNKEVTDKPAKARGCNRMMHVRSLEKLGYQAINRQPTLKE